MARKVIIAEKPSLARNIVAAIDPKMKKRDGFFENEEYLVTYAYGHLFHLYDIEMYREDYNPKEKYIWKMEDLPFFPSEFRFGLNRDEGAIRQFKIIRELVNRDDVDTIVNAGDSDREGEIIVRIILRYALKSGKPIARLWMPDQTPKTIREELRSMKDDANYDLLAGEGFARTYMDWCYGINLTRYATLRSKTLLRVGRVIAPIVQAIYDREAAILSFVPRNYFVLSSKEKTDGTEVELISKIEFEEKEIDRCKDLAEVYNRETAIVKRVQSEKKIVPPGRLFSLSKLQGELGKKYKMSLDASLRIVQNLYEKGYVSYPRTPSQYLAENEKGKFREIVDSFRKLNVDLVFKDSKQIFDDSKIESHSALTPTYKIPKKSDLTEEESKVYKMIANRFFSVFCCESFELNRTTIEISLGEKEVFRLSGDVVLKKGWTVFEEREKKDKILPDLKEGDEIEIHFEPLKKESKPPKRYTVETLNNFLKNPFRDRKKAEEESVDQENEEIKAMFEGVELGTEATRSGIIGNAVASGYISLKDNVYRLEPNGKYYVETLKKLGVMLPKEKTAELGRSLKKVYRGEWNVEDAVEQTKKEIAHIFSSREEIDLERPPRIFEVSKADALCKCPRCQKTIACSERGYRCCNTACGLSLYKDNKLFASLGKKITKAVAKEIFTKGKIRFDDLISKSGKPYSAILVADFSRKYVQFRFEFPSDQVSSAKR